LDDIHELVKNRIKMRSEREENNESVDWDDYSRRTYNYFAKHISDDSFTAWIALYGENVVGTSGICYFYAPPTYGNLSGITAYIMNMYTLPEYRKMGIASKLLDYIIEEARKKNCTKITLNASKMGKPLYERYGFKDVENDMVMYLG
jgi:GNAT superfamily N-acetyltransferase